ncbi:Uncharacterised protein [Yersinia enterocolitica]|nr:Uncharacterised protein [Yersinia enterocolitica]
MQRKVLDSLLCFYLSGDVRGGAPKTNILVIFDDRFGINPTNTFVTFGGEIGTLQLIARLSQMSVLQPGTQRDHVTI